MRYTYMQILDSLPVKKNSNSSWWVKLWVRKVSFLFTYLFINLGFTSNAVSVLSIFIVLAACVCYMIPNIPCTIAAIVFINFWLVLDCVDGNIARCKKAKTIYGEFIDDIGGYFTVAFVYLAIGVCAYNFGGILFGEKNIWLVVMGGVSSVCDILARLIHKDYVYYKNKTLTEEELKALNAVESYEVTNKHSLSYIRRRMGKELGVSGTFMLLTIVCAMVKAYDLMTIFYFLFNGFALFMTTVMYIYKADRYDRERMKHE